MNIKIQYEKTKVSFDYLGKPFLGEIVCSDTVSGSYWFIFDQIDVKPFGGSIEFRIVNGQLESVQDYPSYESFLLCIKKVIDNHRKELCN